MRAAWRAALAAAAFPASLAPLTPADGLVLSWKSAVEPGLGEHEGGGKFSRSTSRCVLPTWNRQEGRMTALLSVPPLIARLPCDDQESPPKIFTRRSILCALEPDAIK
ncbi:unnamed protein product [Prorocentrum cordatum]|uniref:Secreted protein n=1 Tax=Prorocentrum cordatum TaxID=2364126 RepID=A0ABN9S0T6_9DINO|nr:unnamed protein product [Polarella glacialis]